MHVPKILRENGRTWEGVEEEAEPTEEDPTRAQTDFNLNWVDLVFVLALTNASLEPGYTILPCHVGPVTRNSSLAVCGNEI